MKPLRILFASDYGMLGALLGLCILFSVITYEEQHPVGQEGANRLIAQLEKFDSSSRSVLIAGRSGMEGIVFAETLQSGLIEQGWEVQEVVRGGPPELGRALRQAFEGGADLAVLACERSFASLPMLENLKKTIPEMKQMKVVYPESYGWPNFLKVSNLLNIANQIAVIAILAIGMTLVIITAGIDLSVGSLIAFSAVLATWIIKSWMGESNPEVEE